MAYKGKAVLDTRFQVSCPICGLLDTFPRLQEAVNYTARVQSRHDEQLEIFDLMTKRIRRLYKAGREYRVEL